MSKKLLSLIVLVLLLVSGYSLFQLKSIKNAQYFNGEHILYQEGDVLGVNSDEIEASIDYGKQISTGSPLSFGGAHAPRLSDTKAWNAIDDAGVTSVRLDFFLDRYLPPKITLEQYKQNFNNAQDPKTWNQKEINNVKGVYQEAHRRNMKVIGILAYSVKWLTNNNSNYGVPKDWAVFDDVAEKSYRIFRDDLDYLEIWNEPDMDVFLDVKNSGMTKDEAYYQLVKHSVAVIRKVDTELNDGKKMKIGVGVMSQPTNTYMLQRILADEELKKQIYFISYHNYEHIKEPSSVPLKQVMAKYNMENTPLFMTEWAQAPNMKKPNVYVLEDQAIPYAGAKLIDILKMGLAGANYFSLQPIIPDSPRGDEGFLGYYTGQGETLTMLPIIKAWVLMSQTLGLGTGQSKVYSVDNTTEKILPWSNSINEYGVVIANQNFETKAYNFTVYNLPYKDDVVLSAYVASADKDGKTRVATSLLKNRSTGSSFKVAVPPNSIVGVTFAPASWRDKFAF